MREVADTVLMLLRTGAMVPASIELRNHVPEEASSLVKLVIAQCEEQAVLLREVTLSQAMAADLQDYVGIAGGYRGVSIRLDDTLGRRLEFAL